MRSEFHKNSAAICFWYLIKSLQFFVHILEETMTSQIHYSEIYWSLVFTFIGSPSTKKFRFGILKYFQLPLISWWWQIHFFYQQKQMAAGILATFSLKKADELHYNSFDQPICTLISNLSGRPDIFLGSGTLKKLGPKYGVQKAGCKKHGHCYSKREEEAWPLLFLNNNGPVFNTLIFEPYILDPIIFQGCKPTHVFKTRIMGADWLGD